MELINLVGEELADFSKVLKLFRGEVENYENGNPQNCLLQIRIKRGKGSNSSPEKISEK